MQKENDARILMCTCPDATCAEKIATQLVQKRLAACVNILPGLQSVYEWQGKVQTDSECQLIIKTTVHNLDAIEALVNELHPYELPELIVVPVSEGSADYLNWIRRNTRKTQ